MNPPPEADFLRFTTVSKRAFFAAPKKTSTPQPHESMNRHRARLPLANGFTFRHIR